VNEGTPRLLLGGRPRIDKTTVARRVLTLLQEAGVPVGGFTTAELRTGGRRMGFLVEAVSGPGRSSPRPIFWARRGGQVRRGPDLRE